MKTRLFNSNLLLAASLIFATFTSFGQDLIVTQGNDSIHCRITKVKNDYFYFEYKNEGKVKETLLSKDQVSFYKVDYFENPDFSKEEIKNREGYKYRFNVQGGYARLTSPLAPWIDPQFKTYLENLRNGFYLGGEFNYFPIEQFGGGVRYRRFQTSESQVFTLHDDQGQLMDVLIKDNIVSNYFAGSLKGRFFDRQKKAALLVGMTLGYTTYQNNGQVLEPITIKGNTLGVSLDLGFEMEISKSVFIGAHTSFFGAVLTSYDMTVNGQTVTVSGEENYESLNRWDIGLGITYNL